MEDLERGARRPGAVDVDAMYQLVRLLTTFLDISHRKRKFKSNESSVRSMVIQALTKHERDLTR